ncbi:uncharacterized protein [Dermacentor andersoni]|uniref:uncharacterized protein n=1 Tax=Dermacentor andersoni TaxID=34620 RepID=UPI002155AD06|nr:uncharacterized protein LOC126526588 [Dermacentor andersoni]
MEDEMNTTVFSNDAPALQPQSTVTGDIPARSAAMDAISNAQLRLPPFWPKNPAVWFTQVEALFDLRRITSQRVMYLHVVSALSSEVADEFDDVMRAPHPAAPYDHFKAIVLTRKTVSERSRLQQLLNAEELGDRRPSQLLHRMRQLLGDRTQDSESPLLRELFLQRLPQTLVVVLAAADDMPLDKLAELADRVNDYSGASSAVSSTTVTSDLEARQSRLEEKIDRLMDTMAAMQMDTPRRSPLARGGSRSRSRSRPRHTSDGFCWYHTRFRASAAKCRQPCRWQGNMEASH